MVKETQRKKDKINFIRKLYRPQKGEKLFSGIPKKSSDIFFFAIRKCVTAVSLTRSGNKSNSSTTKKGFFFVY